MIARRKRARLTYRTHAAHANDRCTRLVTRLHDVGNVDRRRRFCTIVSLALSIAISALVTAFALSSTRFGWLACLALIPLYIAIARCAPVVAATSGALWGSSLYFFGTLVFDAAIPEDFRALLLLSVIPAAYAFLGAHLTRRIGFSPFVLGVGWIGVELAIQPVGLKLGLLAGAQSEFAVLQWAGRALGYTLVAFAVAYVNACLLSVLSCIRVTAPRARPVAASGHSNARLTPQTFFVVPLHSIRPSRPRAPPVCALAWNGNI